MAKEWTTYTLSALCLLLIAGCSKKLPRSEFIPYYEKNCRTQISRDGTMFAAMPLTADYEAAKWGAPLDSGMRVLLWIEPFSGKSLETAFLVVGRDTAHAVSIRKMESFELRTVDSFVLGFPKKLAGAKLHVRNVGNEIGSVDIALKECGQIRLAGGMP